MANKHTHRHRAIGISKALRISRANGKPAIVNLIRSEAVSGKSRPFQTVIVDQMGNRLKVLKLMQYHTSSMQSRFCHSWWLLDFCLLETQIRWLKTNATTFPNLISTSVRNLIHCVINEYFQVKRDENQILMQLSKRLTESKVSVAIICSPIKLGRRRTKL